MWVLIPVLSLASQGRLTLCVLIEPKDRLKAWIDESKQCTLPRAGLHAGHPTFRATALPHGELTGSFIAGNPGFCSVGPDLGLEAAWTHLQAAAVFWPLLPTTLGLPGTCPGWGAQSKRWLIISHTGQFPLYFVQTAEEWAEKMPKGPPPTSPKAMASRDILARLHKAVTSHYHAITQEFENFDTMKTNTISREEFRAVCNRNVQILTDEQVRNAS